jgi:heat-inducible transcriptional repressor
MSDSDLALHDEFEPILTLRQAQVLQALVGAYVGLAAPVGSATLTRLLPMRLSSASVRNTLGELHALGLLEKPHRSAGRVPSELGLRVFVDQLLPQRELGPFERRDLEGHLSGDRVIEAASRLLSERTHQLGFVMAPRIDGVVLANVSFVRVSSERVLAVLVSEGGRIFRRILEEPGRADQSDLDRMASALRERVTGRTLRAVRDQLLAEAAALRSQADLLLERVLRVLPDEMGDAAELVLGTQLALLDQPEFRDPERLRALLAALEERERLVDWVGRMLEERGACVAFGRDLGDPHFEQLAVVAARVGRAGGPAGSVGVIGPSRMDYARVVPLVAYVSHRLGEVLDA